LFCSACGCFPDNAQLIFGFNVTLVVDDGSAALQVSAADAALSALLGLAPAAFRALTDYEQQTALDGLVGRDTGMILCHPHPPAAPILTAVGPRNIPWAVHAALEDHESTSGRMK
jgi:hypothetical protein